MKSAKYMSIDKTWFWAKRDDNAEISGPCYDNLGLPTPAFQEVLDSEISIQTFVDPNPATNLDKLQATDRDFVRVGEDIIEALFTKGILSKADLAPDSIAKMNARRGLRGHPPL